MGESGDDDGKSRDGDCRAGVGKEAGRERGWRERHGEMGMRRRCGRDMEGEGGSSTASGEATWTRPGQEVGAGEARWGVDAATVWARARGDGESASETARAVTTSSAQSNTNVRM